jgi:hypothetical protein
MYVHPRYGNLTIPARKASSFLVSQKPMQSMKQYILLGGVFGVLSLLELMRRPGKASLLNNS